VDMIQELAPVELLKEMGKRFLTRRHIESVVANTNSLFLIIIIYHVQKMNMPASFESSIRPAGLEQPPQGSAKGRGEGEGPPERARGEKVQCTQSCGTGECSRYKKLSDIIRFF